MGQFFDRVSRVVRANLNASQGDYSKNYLSEGTAFVAGGAVAGASVGKVGILAGGAGYSLGAVPLAAAGALTGAALYEVLRSLLESDTSSASAAAIGAVAGAATSAAIGGVGVAAGGSAIGVGMASMAAGGAVVGLGLVGLNRLLQQGVDPEKLLESAIEQMEADLQNARQVMIDVTVSQKRLQQAHKRAQAEIDRWQQRAQLALQKGNEYLAQEALIRKQTHSEILRSLEVQMQQAPDSVQSLKQLMVFEAKIAEAKVLRTRLKAQIAAVRPEGQLGRLGTSSSMAAFERMEEKILQMETRSQAAAELAGEDLESLFTQLESGSDVDAELEAMKAQLAGTSQAQLPPSQSNTGSTQSKLATAALQNQVDAELEALKNQLDQL